MGGMEAPKVTPGRQGRPRGPGCPRPGSALRWGLKRAAAVRQLGRLGGAFWLLVLSSLR